MNLALPDVSLTEMSSTPGPLDWVGMQGIDLPIMVAEDGYRRMLHARADTQVDLPSPQVKGIHMSRLYRQLDTLGAVDAVTPAHLHETLARMVDSHRDCGSVSARLRLRFELLVRRPALVTAGLAGWKSYPVVVSASLVRDVFNLEVGVTVTYSSTCPCSAALARQLIEKGFRKAFSGQSRLSPKAVAAWLRDNATLATPHSQRSVAEVRVPVSQSAPSLGLLDLIDRIEQAVATPVQTAVKREDEQAFAALNGENQMFVEDAIRRIRQALDGRFARPDIHVRHMESLHPHDAVAWDGPRFDIGADQ